MRLRRAFFEAKEIHPSRGLKDRVLGRVERERVAVEWRRRMGGVVLTLGSLTLFFVGASLLAREAAQSGFAEYFSLFFTDQEVASVYLKDFIFSLVESMPVVSVMLTGFAVVGFLLGLRRIGRKAFAPVWHHSS